MQSSIQDFTPHTPYHKPLSGPRQQSARRSLWVLDAAPVSSEDIRPRADLVVAVLNYSQRATMLSCLIECALTLDFPILIVVDHVSFDKIITDSIRRWGRLLDHTPVRLRSRLGWMDEADRAWPASSLYQERCWTRTRDSSARNTKQSGKRSGYRSYRY